MTIRVPIRGREKLAQLLCAQEGFVAVMMALVISALIGVAGLATETGMWYALKRQNQTAADAAALTAAFEYAGQIVTGVTTSPSAAATSTAASNQFSTSAPNAVAVNTPVCTVGNINCTVQVVLTNQLSTLFGRLFLPSTVNIVTTATAAYQTLTNSSGTSVGQTCLLGLGTYGSNLPTGQVIRINGAPGFGMPNCILGSVSTDAGPNPNNYSVRCNGCSNSGSWNVAGIATAGGMLINGQTPPVPIFTQQPIQNPYAGVTKLPLTGTMPTGTQCTTNGSVAISAAHANLSPGCYLGLAFTAGANVILSPGIYYIDGGDFSISNLNSGASITGTGVTIVLTQVIATHPGQINIDLSSCNGTVSLKAPGPNAGMLQPSASRSQGLLIFQDPTFTPVNSTNTITTGGGSTSCASPTVTLAGAIVTPRSDDNLKGNQVAAVAGCTEFIAQSFTFSGNPELDDSGCNAPSGSGGGTVGGSGSTGVTINQAIIEQVFLTQ
jgi:Flp pilus assembly protein TadG